METKDTLSSCSDLDEQEIQQLQKQAKNLKEISMNKLNALKTTTQHLKRQTFTHSVLFERAFSRLFSNDVRTFKYELSQNMNNLKKQLNNEILHEKDSKSSLKTSRTLGESNSIRDSCLVALQNKQTEFERYKAFNDRTIDYDKLKQKHDELVKQSLLTKSHYEGLVNEKTKVITDLKLKEEKDIDKMISIEKQLKFLNEIVYKRNQSIQTIYMLAPKGPTFNGRPTFANPIYLKKAQYEKPCLYEILYDQSDPANRLVPDRKEILTLEKESRSKLNKDLVRPYDYTKLNSLYEIFKPPTQEYHEQLAHANEVRKKMWRKSFVKTKPNIFKNIDFLQVSKSISKSRQAYNVMNNNINHFRELVDQAWVKHSQDHLHLRALTAHDMEILIKTCLMPLAIKTQNDSFAFVHELKQEMHADLKYVEPLEKEINELESNKAEFSNMYDILLQECVSNDVMCSYLHSLSDLDAHSELQCLYLHKVKECEFTLHSWPPVRKSSFAKPYDVNAPGPFKNSPKYVSFQSPRESVGSNDMVVEQTIVYVYMRERVTISKKSKRKRLCQWESRGFDETKEQKNETRRTNSALWDSRRLEVKQYAATWDDHTINGGTLVLLVYLVNASKVNSWNVSTYNIEFHSWKPYQEDSLNLPDHRYKRRCCSPIPAESDSSPHAHAQTTKTYYKHQVPSIKKAQDLKTKTFANSDIKDNFSET
ncbi:hypothetical protein Tco_0598297 [Tanacetum coccineum]